MKIALAVLILYFSINLTSAFGWFNFGAKKHSKQTTVVSTTHRPVSYPAVKQQDHANNIISSHRQPVITSKKKNRTNHSPLQKFVNRHQYNSRNTTAVHRQADNINKKTAQQHSAPLHKANHAFNKTSNRIIHPKFRSSLPPNKNTKTNITRRILAQDSLSKSNATNSKPNNRLFRSPSARTKANVRNPTANNDNRNQQPPLRPSYQHKNVSRTHTHNNSTLKHRHRRNDVNADADPFNSMALVRNQPVDFD